MIPPSACVSFSRMQRGFLRPVAALLALWCSETRANEKSEWLERPELLQPSATLQRLLSEITWPWAAGIDAWSQLFWGSANKAGAVSLRSRRPQPAAALGHFFGDLPQPWPAKVDDWIQVPLHLRQGIAQYLALQTIRKRPLFTRGEPLRTLRAQHSTRC